jgi:hypothetical protein
MTARVALFAGLLLALAAAPAPGQRPFRSGFWLENGVGTGTIRIGCSTCEEPLVAYGQSSYLRGGGGLSPRVVWGIEVFALLNRTFGIAEGDSSLTVENVSIAPMVMWYPWRGGVFLKGGVGFARAEILVSPTTPGGEATTLASGNGSSITFGAGFDVPLRSWLSVTANLGVYFTAVGDVVVQGQYVDDVITSMYNANFALTLR